MVLSDVSIRRPVFTIIIMSVLVLFGAVAFRDIGVDLMPKIEAPYVTVSVIYPGADPDIVENRVLEPIEDAVSTISGLKTLTSRAAESFGLVILEFELNVSADRAVQDVRDQIAKIQRDLPTDAETPIIQKINIAAAPVVTLAVIGPSGVGPAEITHVADKKVRPQLQRLNGVGIVELIGKQEREIHVVADPLKLRQFGLTLPDLQAAVTYGNMDVPGGRLTLGKDELLLKTHGEADDLEELRNLVVAAPAGAPILIKDVAEVLDTTEEVRTLAALDGQRALSLLVRKQADANSVAVADAVIAAVESTQTPQPSIDLPKGYQLQILQNASSFTKQSIKAVVEDLILGALFAVLIIFVFLRDLRATFISALALPTSVIATFAFMKGMGFTLNNLTMLGLSLSIGMLIDDAIVVIENIHRHLEMKKSPAQAAGEATGEIGLAVLATTFTIVAVFVPVAFTKGIVGRFMFEFGMTVAFAVLISLFVSFTLTPMAAAKLLRLHGENALARFLGKGLDWMDRTYRAIIGWVLFHRAITVGIGFVTLILSFFIARVLPFEFQPSMDRGELDVIYRLPEGASLESSYDRGEAIRKLIKNNIPEVRYQLVTVGVNSLQKVNEGKVFVKLPSSKERKRSQLQIAEAIRPLLAKAFPGEDVSVNQAAQGDSGSEMMQKPLSVQLRGSDSEILRDTANRIMAELSQRKQFVDLSLSDRGARPQSGFHLNRDKVAAAGLSPAQVALAVRTAIQGSEVSQFRDGAERYKVVLRAPDSYKRSRDAILGMSLRGPLGNLVELGELVEPFPENAASQIEREDRSRQVTISGNLQGQALGQAQQEVLKVGQPLVPAGVTLKFSGQGKIMKEAFGNLSEALVLAIILIFMVLAAQFESFLHPFTIMVSLPLSLVGALGFLVLFKSSFSMITFIGLILLMGLVTKNAILLVDNANQRRAKGVAVREALIEAGAVRLRPILMTSLAMIFGMLPVALALGEGADFRAPMGIAVVGGLITSTVLTLLVVPAVYSLFESARQRLKALFGRA